MKKLALMNRHLFHQFKKVDHLVVVMGLLGAVETFSILLDLRPATRSIQGHRQTIQDLLLTSNTLDLQLATRLTIQDLHQANSGHNQPLVRQAEHIHPGDTTALLPATTIHLQ